MPTLHPGDKLATTHAAIPPRFEGDLPIPSSLPTIVSPDGTWELLGTTSVCDAAGGIHFFWFWRAPKEGTD